ncbi:MAG: metallophosphoesterase [bacterium]|nr:metallophosphoesterase [bacterium]
MPVRFVVLADTHYHPSALRDFAPPKLLTRGREILAATIPAVNALQPDFILHAGDLLCGGSSFELSPDQYEQSLQDVSRAYAGFTAPVHCVAGNHDCDAQQYRYADFARIFDTPGGLDVINVAPGVRLVRAHIYRDGEAGDGTWTDELDAGLRAADRRARDEGAVLFLLLHTWIHPGAGESPTKGIIGNAGALQAALAECPTVAATFSGHHHANRIRLFRDYVCIDTACLIGYPLGFREMTLAEDGWLTSTWHTLHLPSLFALSAQLDTPEHNHHWAGEFGDRDNMVLLPRTAWAGGGSRRCRS